MTTRAKKITVLVDHVAHECAISGIKFELRNTETVVDRHTIGFFSAFSKELIVAAKDEDFEQVVGHEFSHLKQWREGVFDCEDEYEAWDEWLTGTRSLDPATVIHNARLISECELDCEKRTVKLLEQFGLLSARAKRQYVKRANAYVYMHEIARQQGRWSVAGRSPMEKQEIWDLLPAKFTKDVGRVPDDFLAAVLEHCY